MLALVINQLLKKLLFISQYNTSDALQISLFERIPRMTQKSMTETLREKKCDLDFLLIPYLGRKATFFGYLHEAELEIRPTTSEPTQIHISLVNTGLHVCSRVLVHNHS